MEALRHISFLYVLVLVPQVEQILVCVCAKPGYDNNSDFLFISRDRCPSTSPTEPSLRCVSSCASLLHTILSALVGRGLCTASHPTVSASQNVTVNICVKQEAWPPCFSPQAKAKQRSEGQVGLKQNLQSTY